MKEPKLQIKTTAKLGELARAKRIRRVGFRQDNMSDMIREEYW